jgi:hypothetical protein
MSALDVPCGTPHVCLMFDYPFRVGFFVVYIVAQKTVPMFGYFGKMS